MNSKFLKAVVTAGLSGLVLGGCASPQGQAVPDGVREAAERGDANAQYRLALASDFGRGVPRDPAEAAKWYRKAADQGNAEAQNSLGSMYQHGQGVPVDYDNALSWYQKAAAQGHAEATANIGALYDFGLGVAKDERKAVDHYQAAAEKGSVTAMLNLGVSYWRGEGVQKDLVQAYKWLDLGRFYTQTSPNQQLKWRIRGVLESVEKEASQAQITEGKRLARSWDALNRPK
ncbi:MAG: tetratricopeptide repeat protein [Gemmataceae bacterium]